MKTLILPLATCAQPFLEECVDSRWTIILRPFVILFALSLLHSSLKSYREKHSLSSFWLWLWDPPYAHSHLPAETKKLAPPKWHQFYLCSCLFHHLPHQLAALHTLWGGAECTPRGSPLLPQEMTFKEKDTVRNINGKTQSQKSLFFKS